MTADYVSLDLRSFAIFDHPRLSREIRGRSRASGRAVILIVYDTTKEVAYYVHYQTVPQSPRRSVRIPTISRFDANAARQLRDAKNIVREGRP